MVPPFMRIEPVAAEKVSVLAVLVSVPVRFSAPPAILLKVPAPVLIQLPPRLTVLVTSTTEMSPVLLQLPVGVSASVAPLRASMRPPFAKVPVGLMVRV